MVMSGLAAVFSALFGTPITATLFAIYTLGVFGYACQELFNKILYLDSKYSYTVIGTVAVIALKVISNIFLKSSGAVAIAVSTTVLFTLYAIVIAFAIGKVTGKYIDKPFVKNICKILASCAAAFAVFAAWKMFLPNMFGGNFGFLIPLGACAAVYLVALYVSGIVKVVLKGRNADNPQ